MVAFSVWLAQTLLGPSPVVWRVPVEELVHMKKKTGQRTAISVAVAMAGSSRAGEASHSCSIHLFGRGFFFPLRLAWEVRAPRVNSSGWKYLSVLSIRLATSSSKGMTRVKVVEPPAWVTQEPRSQQQVLAA